MKKLITLLFVFLLGIVFIPMVHAEELPREGVTYFMTYPDGEVVVTEDYDVAINPPEKLLKTLTTDQNGNVPLCDCITHDGTLRIVQQVPKGYTTNQREIIVDASNPSSISFVDYRGGNPVTARNGIILLVLLAVVGATVLVSRKNKKALMMIPVVLSLFAITKVYAEHCNVLVTVKDGEGKALADVVVEVYGTPTVEAAPAIKFDANGGRFFNGEEYVYAKLPSAECTVDAFWDSLTDEESDYYEYLLFNGYRDGYDFEEFEYPDVLRNGSVVKALWYTNEDRGLIRIVGNGGTYDFYGEKLEEITLYSDQYPFDYMTDFKNDDGYYYIGYDNNAACSNFTSGGISEKPTVAKANGMNVEETYYLCWNAKPDGIYVNGVLFRGNVDTCYNESYFGSSIDSFAISNTYPSEGYLETIFMYMSDPDNFLLTLYGSNSPKKSGNVENAANGKEDINTLEVVYNGRSVVALESSDLYVTADGDFMVINQNKLTALMNYLSGLYDNYCMMSPTVDADAQ